MVIPVPNFHKRCSSCGAIVFMNSVVCPVCGVALNGL